MLMKLTIKDTIAESDYCPDKLGNKGDDRVSFSSTTVYSNPITSEVSRRFYSLSRIITGNMVECTLIKTFVLERGVVQATMCGN